MQPLPGRDRGVDSILADVRSLADRGDHHTIIERYGTLDDMPAEETWQSTELLFEIGRSFGMLGNEEKVERYLLRCAELAPRRAAVFHCAIGWYFQRKKKWTKALRWYDRALASFPTYHLCLFRRGYCLEKLHRPREAVEALVRAREIWEHAPSEQRQRGRGVQVQVLFHLSRGYRDLGEFEQAAEALDICWELDAHNDPPAIRGEHRLACRGELALRRGDLDVALATFSEARDLDPSSSYLWERLGRAHELRADHAEAERCYRHAAGLPRGAFAALALGRYHLGVTHDLPAAAAALADALAGLRSAEPLVRLELARLELACGRPRAALEQVVRALDCRRDQGFAEGSRLAADIAERLGRNAEAVRHLEQVARLAPGDTTVLARLEELARRSPVDPEPPADAALPPALTLLSDNSIAIPSRERVEGIIDRFFVEKGFGFVQYGDGRSIFFHVTQCEDLPAPAPGVRVSFVVGHNPKKGKPQAEAVRFAH
jgi:tetratricopeptide (TPR) repeat protein/cold shock CspA family protein